MPLYVRAMAAAPWHSTTADLLNDWLSAQAAHPWAHLLAHISMLHGMLSYNLLPGAPFVYLPPAWSLSLEWQFYLLAPFAIAAVRNYIGEDVGELERLDSLINRVAIASGSRGDGFVAREASTVPAVVEAPQKRL